MAVTYMGSHPCDNACGALPTTTRVHSFLMDHPHAWLPQSGCIVPSAFFDFHSL